MDKLLINGGKKLSGRVKISGAKNACLPILAACLLTKGEVCLKDVPLLSDVHFMKKTLERLGVQVYSSDDGLKIKAEVIHGEGPPFDLVSRMRASFLTAGALLARRGRVRISLPGGCSIGRRPIDLHLKGFRALGAKIEETCGYICIQSKELKGERIYLDFPSVGATENLMMAASRAKGITVIENAAEEPEVVDLANFLNALGAKVSGAGTKIIRVEGVKHLGGAVHTIIPDRVEAGTFMVAAAVTGSRIILDNVILDHLKAVAAKLKEAGACIKEHSDGGILVNGENCSRPIDIKTLPYPGFPTDMQAQFMVMLTLAEGNSVITENIFENRFMHVSELNRMGANIRVEGASAFIQGVQRLQGFPVRSTDLRAGASLVLAGLVARGRTEVLEVNHIDRGYCRIDEKLRKLGADIHRVKMEEDIEAETETAVPR
ncbi:UDP-N-acetylglucosamine 1-carboxyvinyltransferase [Candidatus Contubernalis alkaliaceticus]|uniref:UDP-N-acetylglucosamine 1-carboxyvinyltransferase n=1 Tax=Candidatus Contubernalis alkaliaceticus TaxID=338645 RepID=UPI001F4C3425|nr:UDP-N-acetylglucosamine 1-carboxyvinyltransferase [Candidatus Contubernalis alkalaceticus]UNC93657.1 UDP-N-acetylglucosamine 1-carboxyvinyltransferase [Candidatus Contubernalis alkalaceticus]